MDLFWLYLMTGVLCCSLRTVAAEEGLGTVEEVLDDFPLEDAGGGTPGRSDEGGGSLDETDLNDLEDIDLSELQQTEASRQELLRKVMSAAMAKPGARQRLAQVMPILRTMSATQRLALAGLVTSQLMAPPGATPPKLNTTQANVTDDLMIPISMDIAAMFRGLGRDSAAARSNLFRGELYKRHPPYRRRPVQTPNRRNTEVPFDEMKPPPLPGGRVKPPKFRPSLNKLHPPPPPTANMVADDEAGVDCEFFTNSLCLQVSDYPMEAILKSIQATPNKNAFEALKKDAKTDFGDIYSAKEVQLERRTGSGLSVDPQENQHMCSSKVEVARPKRARATSGQWKYVVNTGDYTQTLRLEMCLRPQQSCSYLPDSFKSECTQVYNYHRLLTWDQKSGLTMDIFKVPTCCSCHVLGASHPFQQRQETSESVRHPSQPTEPVRHATPPPRINPGGEGVENNLVVTQEKPVVHRLPPAKILRRPGGGLHNTPKRESLPPSRLRPPQSPNPEVEHPQFPPQYENLLRRTINRNSSELNEVRPQYHPVLPTLNQRHPDLPVDSLLSGDTFAFVTSEPDYLPSRQQDHRYHHNVPQSTYASPPKRGGYQTTLSTTVRRPTHPHHTTLLPPTTTTSYTTRRQPSNQPNQQSNSKRVNYSYHPIIDFFKTSVSSGKGQAQASSEWTPMTDTPQGVPKVSGTQLSGV